MAESVPIIGKLRNFVRVRFGYNMVRLRFFDGAVTAIKITYNDKLLATGSADGTLVIWSILNNEGELLSIRFNRTYLYT